MALEKWQRNEMFRAIEAAGLEPEIFELQPEDEGGLIRLSSAYADSQFAFSQRPSGFMGAEVVGGSKPAPVVAANWQTLMQRISRWLTRVKRDLDEPDLWEELRSERGLGGKLPRAVENTPFTAEEQAEIAEQLASIKDYAEAAYALTEEQTRRFEESLDQIEEAAGRLGRLDWRQLVVGSLVTLVLENVLPREAFPTILSMLARGVAHLVGGLFGVPLTGLPPG